MKKIKTFENACKALGINPQEVLPVSNDKAVIAFAKLMIIAKALNEGWVPDWNNYNEYKYYPYFDMRNGLSYYDCVIISSFSCVGSRLCYKSRKLAKYAATQFIDLYREYMS